MGYIQNHLISGETVVYEAKLHSIVYMGPILLSLCAFGVAFIPVDPIAIVCLVLGIWIFAFAWAISIYGGRQYVVTTHRLIFKRGIIMRRSFELLLRKCEGVQVEQSILGRILGYGSVLVTTGEATNRYKHIRNPFAFSTKIHEQINNLN